VLCNYGAPIYVFTAALFVQALYMSLWQCVLWLRCLRLGSKIVLRVFKVARVIIFWVFLLYVFAIVYSIYIRYLCVRENSNICNKKKKICKTLVFVSNPFRVGLVGLLAPLQYATSTQIIKLAHA